MTAPHRDVTILVTLYEQAPYVRECVSSALNQTLPCKVVVFDDGSTDQGPQIAEALGVDVVRLRHQGALQTFRTAVGHVETEFYCILNGDDALEPEYVQQTRPLLEDPSVGFVYTGARLVWPDHDEVKGALAFDPRALRFGNYVHAASLTRIEAYNSVGGFDVAFANHHEDWALWVAMASAGWGGAAVDSPLLRYRQNPVARRNRTDRAAIEQVRWLLARKHPSFFGVGGFARLVMSTAKLIALGR